MSSTAPPHDAATGWRPTQAALMAAVMGALYGLPLVRVAPNRLVSGAPIEFVALLSGPAWLLLACLGALLAMSWLAPRRTFGWVGVILNGLAMVGLLALAANHATTTLQADSPLARTSLGSGFWLVSLLLTLNLFDLLQSLRVAALTRSLVIGVVLGAIGWLLASGACDELSLLKEYAVRSDELALATVRHLHIVGLALVLTLTLGLPLGWMIQRHARLSQSVFACLNIIQTIPSIALFGLLMAPLAWLALQWPTLGQAGISGVGLAPGVIALVLYSLLPVVRATVAGLAQVPAGVLNAAQGLGLSAWQMFWHAQLPLALPVILGGIRTASIQAVGLAAVTALIGAGGLGSIMFEGLFSSAQDLVLLGVLPIVVLGVLTGGLFQLLIDLSGHAHQKGVPGA